MGQAPSAVTARVPGVAEQYLYEGNGPTAEVEKAAKGVTWWWRSLTVPQTAPGQRVRLCFESARLRAEVYLDQKLVGYNLIEGTPFEVDITDQVKPKSTHQLAVRITNPGGNYEWKDYEPIKWGKYQITAGRAFGGITGPVTLIVSDPVYTDDLYVQNTADPQTVRAFVTIRNSSKHPVKRSARLTVAEKGDSSQIRFTQTIPEREYPSGDTTVDLKIRLANAKRWDIGEPNLYVCRAELFDGAKATDAESRVFGFRWFNAEGIGKDAVLRLNGRRVFLRSAISWGLWPITGMIPTEESADRHIQSAKAFGLNMLNFHRALGTPLVLNKADEAGVLYLEEPGGYRSANNDAFARDYAQIKLMRMIKRDRSHPSLIIWNLVNEYEFHKDPKVYERQQRDMAEAHQLDPSRLITLASGWARKPKEEEPVKLHMRPFDDRAYKIGWYDYHRAPGPATFSEADYAGPTQNLYSMDNREEIVFWGEESAISTPPRLDLIKAELSKPGAKPGFEGNVYLDWQKRFSEFLDKKNLRTAFPTVDSLTTAMGAVGLNNQGRRIQMARATDQTDGYVVNGWDATIRDNHSGIVDGFRFPKADPSLIARYNRPLYVAIIPRTQVAATDQKAAVDFYLVNEANLKGKFKLKTKLKNKAGQERTIGEYDVAIEGGDHFGQPLALNVAIPLQPGDGGMANIAAELLDATGQIAASGSDELLAVNWMDDILPGRGAVYEWGNRVAGYLKAKNVSAPAFDDTQGKLDWIIVARPPQEQPRLVPASAFGQGIKTTINEGADGQGPAKERTDATIDFACAEGATPDPSVGSTTFTVKWQGQITPPVTGTYVFGVDYTGNAKLQIGRQRIESDGTKKTPRSQVCTLEMTAGQPVDFTLSISRKSGDANIRLLWSTPNDTATLDPQRLIERAKQGTTIIVADFATGWVDLIKQSTALKSNGNFTVGVNWAGGQYFVKDHPLFAGLPVNCALDWPYQRVVRRGGSRTGLRISGEELVVGAYNTWKFELGTAVGIVPCGNGRIILSTLDICPNLSNEDGASAVAKKLINNFITFSSKPARPQ